MKATIGRGKQLTHWARMALLVSYFVPGRDVVGYARLVDRVISLEIGGDVPAWWSFRVTVRGEDGRVRQHCTMPSDRELLAGWRAP